MIPFNLISGARYDYKAGTGTIDITVPAGAQLWLVSCTAPAGTDATLTIAPGGANQVAGPVAGQTITLLAGKGFSKEFIGILGGGTVISMTGMGSYYIDWFLPRTGAAAS